MNTSMPKVEARPLQVPHAGCAVPQWDVAVERGPDWLFVRIESPVTGGEEGPDGHLAERIWATIREHHAHRVVLELDRVQAIDDEIVGAIADIGDRVRDDGGLIRVCGLSQPNLSKLRSSGPAAKVPHFDSRTAAVVGRAGAGA
jgi:MFS superfamily sulfate permease-like transporter